MNAGGVLNTCKSSGKAPFGGYTSGERVSNTWAICPPLWDNSGKPELIPDTSIGSHGLIEKAPAVEDEPAAD